MDQSVGQVSLNPHKPGWIDRLFDPRQRAEIVELAFQPPFYLKGELLQKGCTAESFRLFGEDCQGCYTCEEFYLIGYEGMRRNAGVEGLLDAENRRSLI